MIRTVVRRGGKIAWLGLFLMACQSPSGPTGPEAYRTHEGLNATLWLQTAAEYPASTIQAYQSAARHLDDALADPTWTAALEQTGDFGSLPTALILDMDEAIIRSDRFQATMVRDHRPFRIEDWNDWVRTEESSPVPGALDFVAEAQQRGVEIFFVTNRTYEVKEATLRTLLKLGFPVDPGGENLLTKDERPDWGTDKSTRRAFLARSHRIVQIVGDNLNDFISGARGTPAQRKKLAVEHSGYWGTRWIITPNPAYGGWEGALYGFDYGMPREEVLDKKRRELQTQD